MTSWGLSQGRRVREAREALALSQSDLGDRIGLAGAVVHYFESGVIDPGPSLERIAVVLDRPSEWFRGESEHEPPAQEDARKAPVSRGRRHRSRQPVPMHAGDAGRLPVADAADGARAADLRDLILGTRDGDEDHPVRERGVRMPTETFAAALQRAAEQAGSIRKLGELISPEDPERGERRLKRWRRAYRESGALPRRPSLRLLTERTGIDFMPFTTSYATLLARYLETARRAEQLRWRALELSESLAVLRATEGHSSDRTHGPPWRSIPGRLRNVRRNVWGGR